MFFGKSQLIKECCGSDSTSKSYITETLQNQNDYTLPVGNISVDEVFLDGVLLDEDRYTYNANTKNLNITGITNAGVTIKVKYHIL